MADASTLAAQYVRLIAEQVGRMGVSVDAWLALGGLTRADLDAADFSLDFPTFRRLCLDAMTLTEEPGLGLLIGQQLGMQAHGALGYAAMSSRTLREVVELIQRYIGLRIALVTLSIEAHPAEVRATLVEIVPLGDVRGMVIEGVVTTIKNVLDDVSMGAADVVRASFALPDPDHVEVAASVLRCPVAYGQDWSGLALDPGCLDLPLKMSDPKAFRLAQELCDRELVELQASRSWVARVQRVLLESRVGFPSLEATARRLHVTPRTLHRRLVAEGSSYRKVLEALRFRIAADQLTQGDASIEEIAYILGYGDPANFRRAFRRWAGMPPSRFRAER
jgi:AraC-like DNA-binding protein